MNTEPIEVAPEKPEPTPVLALPTRASERAQHAGAGQVVLSGLAVLAACYFAKMPLVVVLVSILIAFILAPLVDLLERVKIHRALGALIVVALVLAVIGGVGAYGWNAAADFAHDLPKYSGRVREVITRFQQKAQTLQKGAQGVLPESTEQKPQQTVRVEQSTGWGDWLFKGAGSVTEVLFACGFIPFLVYFMLSWQEHVRASTVMLFDMPNRNTAYVALSEMTRMIRSFIVGNVLVGLFISGVTILIFGVMGLPYFYCVGLISGFLSLVPYLGVLLALVPPLLSGMGAHIRGSDVLIIVATVLGLHVFALNVLYPKFVGSRVQLNPLAVTLALLLWGFLWGAMGLILAIPITAALKIILDHIDNLRPYGAWLGE
jgi:predicted PurR-regulated permease PerM